LSGDARPALYVPYAQLASGGLSIVIRTDGDPMTLVTLARTQIHSVDPTIPVTNIRTMDEVLSTSVEQQRFSMLLVGLFGGLAVALAAIGIYGVMGYSVTQRRQELAVRLALGARTRQVLQLVLKDSLVLASLGVVVGLAGAFALTRLLRNLLFEVQPTDVQTFVSVAALLIFVAVLASYLPARRASRVDPLAALRNE
jgi:putative ABC transport system permease protein